MTPLTSAGIKLALIVAASFPAVAHAGYVNDGSQWLLLTPDQKAGYVQGLNDSLNFVFSDDSLVNALAKQGRTKCLASQRTTAAILADRITTAYRDPRFARLAPTGVYIVKMQEVCRSYINEERARFSLGPI